MPVAVTENDMPTNCTDQNGATRDPEHTWRTAGYLEAHGFAVVVWAFMIGFLSAMPQAVAQSVSNDEPPARRLRQTVVDHLRAGRVEDALEAAQRGLAAHSSDEDVRSEFISLHVSLARKLISDENYDLSERALEAALRVDENHPAARGLLKSIRQGRADAPDRVARAHEWIELEWFEPAFVTYRQAAALQPDRRREWLPNYRTAAIGAGDDEYLTKNFHEAFYFYDAALRLGDELAISPPASLLDRWLQCMAHALSRDIDRATYPPDYWKLALRRAAVVGGRDSSATFVHMLRGLAYENLGDDRLASESYARFLGERSNVVDVREGRGRAIRRLRQRYDPSLCGRRSGPSASASAGDWQTLDGERFIIRHRNADVAALVARAAAFHFSRISDVFSLDENEVPWTQPCIVHLYPDAVTFRQAAGQSEDVRAVSVIQSRGRRLDGHEIHVFQTDAMLLSASLSHEIAHLMIGAMVEYQPMPGAISEGLALSIEPQCRRRQFARLFRELPAPRSIERLLVIPNMHPAESAFYSESLRLVDIMVQRIGPAGMLACVGNKMTPAAVAAHGGFRSVHELTRAFLDVHPSARRKR